MNKREVEDLKKMEILSLKGMWQSVGLAFVSLLVSTVPPMDYTIYLFTKASAGLAVIFFILALAMLFFNITARKRLKK